MTKEERQLRVRITSVLDDLMDDGSFGESVDAIYAIFEEAKALPRSTQLALKYCDERIRMHDRNARDGDGEVRGLLAEYQHALVLEQCTKDPE